MEADNTYTCFTNIPERPSYEVKRRSQGYFIEDNYARLPKVGFNYGKRDNDSLKQDPYLKLYHADKVFLIPAALNDIVEEIIHSQSYLALEDDWDSFGASAVDTEIYKNCIDWLIQYSTYIYSSSKIVLKGLEINLCPNGSLDLSWVTEKARLLINFKIKDDTMRAFFYGYITSNTSNQQTERRGEIDLSTFDESLAVWMRSLT
jgi:hypothetical protein